MPGDRLYIETSVWNFLLVDDAPDKRAATEQFFDLVTPRQWEISISALVADEIAATPDPDRRSELQQLLIQRTPLVLPLSPPVFELAEKYIPQGTLSRKHLADALHVASAVVADRDVVVSWNLRHLVKVKTRREVNAANLLNGYRTIEIATPEEMI